MKKRVSKKQKPKKKIGKWIFWTPRILTILFLLFLALFSLDVFELCNSFLSCAGALFIHNIPVLILIVLFIFAWKKEIIGAYVFAIAGLLYIAFVLNAMRTSGFQGYYLAWIIQISGISFIISYLYYLNWKRKR